MKGRPLTRLVFVSRSAAACSAQANALAPGHDVTVVSNEPGCNALDARVELLDGRLRVGADPRTFCSRSLFPRHGA